MAIEVLGPRACRRLLAEVPVGWLAHCEDGVVHMKPVNFTVHEAEVVVRSAYGETLTAVVQGQELTLGAGSFDETTRTGWSVVVTGRARLLGADLVNPGVSTEEGWAGFTDTVAIAVPLTTVTGRRVGPDTIGRGPGGSTGAASGRPARRP